MLYLVSARVEKYSGIEVVHDVIVEASTDIEGYDSGKVKLERFIRLFEEDVKNVEYKFDRYLLGSVITECHMLGD